jgi:putative endonuclease
MQGRVVRVILRALDAAARLLPRQRRAAHLVVGREGEDDAYFYLRRHGYIVVARNWRTRRRRGELDLVAWDGNVLCFVEVKTRSKKDFLPAEAAVDRPKRRELAAMAHEYCRRLAQPPAMRFDIVSVYREHAAEPPQITLFKNAFGLT